jgi:alpha-galactosidase
MAETDAGHEPEDASDQTVLRSDHLEVVWEHGAQLTLRDVQSEHTRVAGGPLLELAPLPGERRPRTLGLGLDYTGARAPDPERFSDVHGSGLQVHRSFPIAVEPLTVEWTLRVYDRHPFVRCMLSLQHIGPQPLVIRRVFPFVTGAWWGRGSFQLGDREHGLAVYKTGWQSWSYAGGLPAGRGDPRPRSRVLSVWHNPGGRDPHQPVTGLADVVSAGVAMLGHPESQKALLAGFLGEEQWLTQVYAQRQDGALAACVLCDDYELAPGTVIEMPPLLLALGTRDELLPAYAEALGREQGARTAAHVPTGWCSWYHYYQQVSEAAVLENLASLRAVRPTLPLEIVQIDDGYQTAVGDWLDVNERFPHGMAWLAERIRETGFKPGLWVAPFTVAANSRLAQEHPSWVVQGGDGKPAYGGRNWGVELYGLDTSHPDARDWLRTQLRTIVEQWGYEYLKLDFLASAAVAGRRFSPLVTRGQALRDGLALIRETVGDDVFLLGCGCPLLSAVGVVDAMRIGPDAAAYWKPRYRGIPLPVSEGHARPAMEGALRNTLERAWMAPALWVNDPDCLLLRDTKSVLTTAEVQAVASAIGLTGGMVLLSDRLGQLTLERLDIAARLLPPMRERALPLDPFEYGVPERVGVRIERPWGRWLLLGLFNTAATERELSVTWPELGLAPGEYHAVEFWTGTYLGLSDTGAAVRVGGHGAAVLAIHAAQAVPMLLSTSFHISQGGMEIAEWEHDHERNALHWHARLGRQAAGTFTLWLPETLRPVRVSGTAGKTNWARGPQGEVMVTAEIRDEARFTLELEGAS